MIHSLKFTCVLDTNVIYPLFIRDLLFWFAFDELYTPKWSKHIFDEWQRVMERKGIPPEESRGRVQNAQLAFPDAEVQNYEPLIETLELQDPDDRHVLAAAIKINANLIVTNNLKHFPEDYLNQFGLSAKSADDFLTDIIDLNPQKAIESFMKMVRNKKSPPLNEFQVLDSLRNLGLTDTADYLHSQI